jgi:hypothetical protein
LLNFHVTRNNMQSVIREAEFMPPLMMDMWRSSVIKKYNCIMLQDGKIAYHGPISESGKVPMNTESKTILLVNPADYDRILALFKTKVN